MTDSFRASGAIGELALASVLVLAIGATAAGRARADEPEADQQALSPVRVEWNDDWARFRPWEYAATTVVGTQALLVRFFAPLNRVQDSFSLDDDIVGALSLTGSARDVVGTIADVAYLGSMAYTVLDSTVVPGLVWGNGDVALQMTMIDLESFALSAFVLWNAQVAFGRERPRYRDCPSPAAQDVDCDNEDDERYRSFIAGHALIVTTAAGLTCVHHSHLPLYGGGAADDVACGGMIGLAAFVGLARIMDQKHHPTDVLLAWGIGTLAGYVVPSAFHYGFGRASKPSPTARHRSASDTVRVTVIPGAGTISTGATLAGTF